MKHTIHFLPHNFVLPAGTIGDPSLSCETRCFYELEYKIKPVSLVDMKALPHFFVVKLVPWSDIIQHGMPYGK